MSTELIPSPTRTSDRERAPETSAVEHTTTMPERPRSGRWWFVFDRWLAVTGAADAQDEFVLA